MAKKRRTPAPGSGGDTKSQAARAHLAADQAREPADRRAVEHAASSPTNGASVEPPDVGRAKQEVDRLESELRQWLLTSLEPPVESEPHPSSGTAPTALPPASDPIPEPEPQATSEALVATAPEPVQELDDEESVDDVAVDESAEAEGVVSPAVDDDAGHGAADTMPSESDLEPESSLEDTSQFHQEQAEEVGTGTQPASANGVHPADRPMAPPPRAAGTPRVTQPVYPTMPYQPPAWVADVLAQNAREEALREDTRRLPADPERESPRRRLAIGLIVVLVTALALAAIIWKTIAIGRGGDTQSRSEIGSGGATHSAYGMQSEVTVTSHGRVNGEMHLVLEDPVPAITVQVITPVPDTSIADFEPTIRKLTLTADGQQISTKRGVLHSGDQVTFDLPPRAHAVDLAYRAGGVFVLSEPSVQGRGTVLVTPLIVRPTNNLYGSIVVHSPDVSNVGCSVAGGSLTTCASLISDGWRVTAFPAQGRVNVLAQFTLPGS